jgi:hypothetical protein
MAQEKVKTYRDSALVRDEGAIEDANTALVGIGIDTNAADAAMKIGATNAGSVELGRSTKNVIVKGNLIVEGTQTASDTLNVTDRVIHVNASTGNQAVPAAIVGVAVDRGQASGTKRDMAAIIWDESNARWVFSLITQGDDATLGALQALRVGAFTATGGAVALTANAASSFTTSAGALTLTSAAAATWSTAAGFLTVNGAGGMRLQGGGTTALEIDSAGTSITVQTGATLGTTGTGNFNLPNNGTARFKIEGSSVSANVTAANLDALTGGSATALHKHKQVVINGLTTSGLATGQAAYISAANTATATDRAVEAKSVFAGVYDGTSGELVTGGEVAAAQFTTAGGSPAAGARVWLAATADDTNTGAGKFTATKPVAGFVSEAGICLDPANYAGAKTCKILLQPKAVTAA